MPASLPRPRALVAAVALTLASLLAACPICPDGELRLMAGTVPVAPGETVSLELRYDDYVAGPDRCRGHWYVDGVAGGNATVGTVDSCGTYTAPATPPAASVFVEAGQFERFGCADCCPWAGRAIPLAAE